MDEIAPEYDVIVLGTGTFLAFLSLPSRDQNPAKTRGV